MTYYTLACKGHVLAQLEAEGGLGTMSIPNTNTPLHRLTHVISTVSSVDEVDCRGVASRFISPKSHEDNGAGEGINMFYVILKHRYEYFRMKIKLFPEDIIQ